MKARDIVIYTCTLIAYVLGIVESSLDYSLTSPNTLTSSVYRDSSGVTLDLEERYGVAGSGLIRLKEQNTVCGQYMEVECTYKACKVNLH